MKMPHWSDWKHDLYGGVIDLTVNGGLVAGGVVTVAAVGGGGVPAFGGLIVWAAGMGVFYLEQQTFSMWLSLYDFFVVSDPGPTDDEPGGGSLDVSLPGPVSSVSGPIVQPTGSDWDARDAFKALVYRRSDTTNIYGVVPTNVRVEDFPECRAVESIDPILFDALAAYWSHGSKFVTAVRTLPSCMAHYYASRRNGDNSAMRFHAGNAKSLVFECVGASHGMAATVETLALKLAQSKVQGPASRREDVIDFVRRIRAQGFSALPQQELDLMRRMGVSDAELALSVRELASLDLERYSVGSPGASSAVHSLFRAVDLRRVVAERFLADCPAWMR